MCPNCRAFITTDDKVCPYCEAKVGPRAIERRYPADVLGGLIPHARFTTMMILLINAGFFLATLLYSSRITGQMGLDPDQGALLDFGGKSGYDILIRGQWWRLITAGFLHGGIMHILMNSWVLFDLGVAVEEAYGTSRYLVIYFISTIIGLLPIFAIDNAAHIGGGIGGFIIGYIAGTPRLTGAGEGFWRGAAIFAVIVTALAFAQMFLGLTSTHS